MTNKFKKKIIRQLSPRGGGVMPGRAIKKIFFFGFSKLARKNNFQLYF